MTVHWVHRASRKQFSLSSLSLSLGFPGGRNSHRLLVPKHHSCARAYKLHKVAHSLEADQIGVSHSTQFGGLQRVVFGRLSS